MIQFNGYENGFYFISTSDTCRNIGTPQVLLEALNNRVHKITLSLCHYMQHQNVPEKLQKAKVLDYTYCKTKQPKGNNPYAPDGGC